MNNTTNLFSDNTVSTETYRKRISFKSTMIPLAMVICLSIIRGQFGVLLFHTLAELFSVVVGILMMVIVWNTHSFTRNDFLLYLGIGYFWIAMLDTCHTFTVEGIPFFKIVDAEITLHFWIYNRIIEAFILLSAPLFLKRKLNVNLIFYSGAVLALLVTWASFTLREPVMMTSAGLTAFKVNTEYFIITLLCTAIFVYIRKRDLMARNVFFFLLASLILTIIAELFFTLYTDFKGIPFVIGHLFKFLSFWMIYQAIVQTTLNEPFTVLARASGSYDAIPHPAIVVDNLAVISQVNRAAEKSSGKYAHQLVHKQVHQFFHPTDVAAENCKLCQAIQQGKSMENQIVWFPEKKLWFLVSLAPIKVGEKTSGMVQSLTDISNQIKGSQKLEKEISERKRVEEELHHLRNYLSNIIDSMPSLLVGIDPDGKITQWNKTAEQITGITVANAQGKFLYDVFPHIALEMKKITESIRTRKVKLVRKSPRLTENGTCYEDIIIYPLLANGMEGAVIRIDDVTDKVRMEEMMIQSEKMLSVGGLAAGMAHEINNPMAGMMQSAEVMSMRLGGDMNLPANLKAAEEAGTTMEAIKSFMEARSIPRMINAINESGRRVTAIVDNMLSFARKSDAQVSSHDLSDLMDKTLELARTDYDLKKQYDFKQIKIHKEYEENLPLVPCEGAKIQQVLLNILRNGAQAMHAAETKNPQFIVRTQFKKEKELLIIEIEDNGPGMDEETRKRIFEPFFTTKPAGAGTGLGLSVSYFIITENHGGELVVESRSGFGAKFIIRLPAGQTQRNPILEGVKHERNYKNDSYY